MKGTAWRSRLWGTGGAGLGVSRKRNFSGSFILTTASTLSAISLRRHFLVQAFQITPAIPSAAVFQESCLFSTDNIHGEKSPSSDASFPTGGVEARLSQRPRPTNATQLQMVSFYHFEPISDPFQARNDLFEAVSLIPGLRGTVYIAREGVNAQLAVPPGKPLESLLEACRTKLPINRIVDQPPNLGDIVDIDMPTFDRLIVRTRDYVLRDGLVDNDITGQALDWQDAGREVAPAEWHETLQTLSPTIVDCRNSYESQKGSFRGAIPLETQNFHESWEALREATKDLPKDQPLAIFCTGGIRCVKTGAFLKQSLGFKNVTRLQHGIVGYQKYAHDTELTDKESLWQGENFLFDKRQISA